MMMRRMMHMRAISNETSGRRGLLLALALLLTRSNGG